MEVMQGLSTQTTGLSANAFSGQLYERAPYNGVLRVLATGDATGDGRLTLFAGGRVLMPESPISRQARFPIDPDDAVLTAPVRQGEQLVAQWRAAGGGTSILYWKAQLRRRR